jgi:hypothetical protein
MNEINNIIKLSTIIFDLFDLLHGYSNVENIHKINYIM